MTNTMSEHPRVEMAGAPAVLVGIAIPGGTWVERYEVPLAEVTPDYLRALHETAGASNGETFRGYQPGEVQFLGAVGRRSGDSYAFEFQFAKWPNRSPAPRSFAGLNIGV